MPPLKGVATPLATERLQKERQAWLKDHPPDFQARPVKNSAGEQDLFIWDCMIPGPKGTLWEGGLFPLKLLFPGNFPEEPPIARFEPPVPHPNVFDNGNVCLTILQAANAWSPGIGVRQILTGVQQMLDDPNKGHIASARWHEVINNRPREYDAAVRAHVAKFRPKG